MVLIAQIALGVIIAVAQAAEPKGTLTLACQGTITTWNVDDHSKSSDQVTMGIIINFQERTVAGLTPGVNVPITIDAIDEMTISFSGKHIDGTIDRVTGALNAYEVQHDIKTQVLKIMSNSSYDLQCQTNATDALGTE
jgi:hypothetical protein